MERIFIGLVVKDRTAPNGYYLRNLVMDKVYDSNRMFGDFEGREVIVKVSDMEKAQTPLTTRAVYCPS